MCEYSKFLSFFDLFTKRIVKLVDMIEMRAFVGLFYSRAFFQWNFELVDRLWNIENSHPIFTATMSRTRFQTILKFLSFDNKETRKDRYRRDRMAAIRSELLSNLSKNILLEILWGHFVPA